MAKKREFLTGLLVMDEDCYPPPPYRGRGWRVTFKAHSFGRVTVSVCRDGRSRPAREVRIQAASETAAQRAADLIHSARLVLDGSAALSNLLPGEHAPIYPTVRRPSGAAPDLTRLDRRETSTPHIPLACIAAARASWRRPFAYALAKLRLSLDTFSTHAIDRDPAQGDNIPKSSLPEDHVRMSNAIVLAYGCLEEIGLEVRASQKNPSTLPDGTWNPPVRKNLEERLSRSGVDLAERFHWDLRGPRTRIEMTKAPPIASKAQWSRYRVRDGEIEVVDAINYASFLRSKVASHRTTYGLIRVLSVYDVANAQMLARRLVLESLRLWRYWGKRA